MSTIPDVAHAIRQIFVIRSEQIATQVRFVRRRDKLLCGALFVQSVVFTLLGKPQPAISDYCRTAAARGLPISEQGFDQNFNEAATELLLAVLKLVAALLITAGDPVAAGLLARFSAVFVFDSSCIALPASLGLLWPGCGNAKADYGSSATLKFTLGLEILSGKLFGFELLEGMLHDQVSQVQQQPIPAQALRLADLGFFNLERFAQISASGGLWFSRLQCTTKIITAEQVEWELEQLLAQQQGNRFDAWVELGQQQRLRGRLIALRVRQEVADNRRRKLHAAARHKGQAVSPRRLAAADWNVYVTNVEAEQLSAEEAVVLAGVRWQIELMFKLWKSHGEVDNLAASTNKWRVLSEVYGKLIAMMLTHWLLVASSWGGLAWSIVGAAKAVRQYAGLLSSWQQEEELVCAITLISRVIRATCRLTKRKRHPLTYQLLLAPDLVRSLEILA